MRSTTELRQHWPAADGRERGRARDERGWIVKARPPRDSRAMETKAERDARRGAALRANLKRRKEQARGQAPDAPAEQPVPDAAKS